MKNLKSIRFVMLALMIGAALQSNAFAAEPTVIVSTDKPSYKVGESATFTVTGGPPNTTIFWTSWKHDPATNTLTPTSETNVPGGVTDQYGNWSGALSPWTSSAIGVRKRLAVIGSRRGFITFAVTPNLTVNSPVIVAPAAVSFSISGAPPNSQILWDTWFNGSLVIAGQYFGHNTNASGNWSSAPADPFLQPSLGNGLYKREAVIGNHRASVEYAVVHKFTVDKAVYRVNDRILFSLTGAPPNTPIFWNAWLNGAQVVTNGHFGQSTDANGNWSALSGQYLPQFVGVWRQRINVGGQQFELAYNVTPAPLYNVYTKKMGVQLFTGFSTHESDLKLYEAIYGRFVKITYYDQCQNGQATTLTWRAQNLPAVNKIFSNPNIHTYHIMAQDAASFSSPNIPLCQLQEQNPIYISDPSALTPQKLSEIANEYKEFTLHLYQQYKGAGKIFILGNAELDHNLYCGEVASYVADEAFRNSCNARFGRPYSEGGFPDVNGPYDMAQNIGKWLAAAQKGIFEGRKQAARNGWYGVEVYHGPEIVSVRLLQNAPPPGPYVSLLDNLLPFLNPGLDSEGEQIPRYDFVSYSAYDSINRMINDPSSTVLTDDLSRIALVAGTGNVFIGEFSYGSDLFLDPAVREANVDKVFNDSLFNWRSNSLVPGVPYVNWWEIRWPTFGLYSPSGDQLLPIGMYFKNKLSKDVFWVDEDSDIPIGERLAAAADGSTEMWDVLGPGSTNPFPFSGSYAFATKNTTHGDNPPVLHQIYFQNAQTQMKVNAGESLYAYVYLDPAKPTEMVMLQWHENGSWEHRAYWGANMSPWGVDGTPSRRFMGSLPQKGGWVRLEIPANDLVGVGLEGKTVTGFAFTLFKGRGAFDKLGKFPPDVAATVTCDNGYDLYFNGVYKGSGSNWTQSQTYGLTPQTGKNVIAIRGVDAGGIAGLLAEIQVAGQRLGSNMTWKVSLTAPLNWTDVNFDDSGWANATDYGPYGIGPWGTGVSGMPIDTPAKWIWSSNNDTHDVVYFRFSFTR